MTCGASERFEADFKLLASVLKWGYNCPMLERYLSTVVRDDLREKMVFLGGPRQVGKTTLAKQLLGNDEGYLNWDSAEHRALLLKRQLPKSPLWVFDEFHKYRGWRNYLKGLYDTRQRGQHILVTGSARLDWYRYGGDSLQGRYHFLRLYPLTLKELGIGTADALESLLRFSGFPEPFFRASERAAKRWSIQYRSRLIQEDIGSIENLNDLGRLELLASVLPEKVGSPLSVNSLREDIQVSPATLARWLDVFERTYAIFRLLPFGAPKLRAVKKERKHYHFDWTVVSEMAARFENLVAVHLLKWVHYQYDVEGRDVELRYFRDVDGREVDFVVVEGRKPILAVECKLTEGSADKGISYFKAKFPAVEAWQIALTATHHRQTPSGIELAPATVFLSRLI